MIFGAAALHTLLSQADRHGMQSSPNRGDLHMDAFSQSKLSVRTLITKGLIPGG
jgi:hypothetical protein